MIKNYKGTRLIRSFAKKGEDFTDSLYPGNTVLRIYRPEIIIGINEFGLDSSLKLGRKDLEKLGYPTRIKVVIYNIDD